MAILYPLPAIFVFTHLIQLLTNTHHLIGPPTDPCLTPLPCLKVPVTLPWASATLDVAPLPFSDPLSREIMSLIASSGIPSALQLIAWDQYSMVSKALLKSVIRMCSSLFAAWASSITSASILRGGCTPRPGRPPYWPDSSTS